MPLLSSTFAEIDVAASSNAALVLEEVYQQHPHLQASMLQRNRWLAKPVDGAMGKGIVLFGNISSSEDLSVSYLPFAGRASEGYVLQKYLENPHLVNIRLLIEVGDRRCERAAVAEIGEELCYKYNLRILVVIRWAEDPSVWVYDQGYIDLCPSPFAQACGEEVQEAHISNLAVHAKCTPAIRKRMWSTDTFGQYLQQTIGRDVWAEDIVPQVRNAVARIISCAMPLQAGGDRRKESEGSSVRQPWRRFGFDFALDSDLHAWLIEANHRPGMKAPKGMAGEDKRELLESLLHCARMGGTREVKGIGIQAASMSVPLRRDFTWMSVSFAEVSCRRPVRGAGGTSPTSIACQCSKADATHDRHQLS